MDFSSAGGIIFKAVAILVSIFYLLYSLVIGGQVKTMGKVVEDKANRFLFIVSSIQTTVALILLIFSIFLI